MEFGRWKLKHCRYGWMLFAGPYIGKCFELYGQYSESEVSLMRQFVREGSVAIDVIKIDVNGKELEVLSSGEMQIEKHRPVLYFENDFRESSAELLAFVIDKLGYKAYWHPAPIFDEKNFFGNPVNHWAPQNIVSLMVLAVPAERKQQISGLRQVQGSTDWWDA